MKRFFGIMPCSEIEVEKRYKDKYGFTITIEAGKNGWTVIYADSSIEFKDIAKSVEENFNEAYSLAVKKLGELCEVN